MVTLICLEVQGILFIPLLAVCESQLLRTLQF